MVVHSATKFLNGHSDLLAGVAAISGHAPEGMVDQLRFLQNALGSVLSPQRLCHIAKVSKNPSGEDGKAFS